MISERSCDTEDSKNSALPSQEEITFLNILQKPVHLNVTNILQYNFFNCIF